MKKILLALALVLLIVIAAYVWFWTQLQPVSSSAKKVSFVVTKSQTGNSIIINLQTAGLIRSGLVSKVYLRLAGLSQQLKPGGYVLSPDLTTPQVFALLVSGPKDVWVTFPEGWRREQIASRLKSSLSGFDAAQFNRISAAYEGQLFPDTYLIPAQANPSEVLQILLKNFSQKSGLDPASAAGKNTLILASLVEREARTDSDRQLIAGIFQKRLANSWPLQVDASVQYALATQKCSQSSDPQNCNWWPAVSDTKFPSLFNTYLHPGLPPGPICNPGLASIQAVLHPQPSSYWYYLTDPDGHTHYSVSLDQHNQNIDKYLRP